jgi:hypothetical protein
MQSIEIPSSSHKISSYQESNDTLDNVSNVLSIILKIILIIILMKYFLENAFGNRIWPQLIRLGWIGRYNPLGQRGPPPPPQQGPPPPQGPQGPPPPPAQGQPIAAGPGQAQPPRQQPMRLARLNQMNQVQQQAVAAGSSGPRRGAVQHVNLGHLPSSPPPLPPLPPRSALPNSYADQALPNEPPLSPSPWISRGNGFGGSGVSIEDEMTDDYDHIDISQNKSRLTIYHVNQDKVEFQNENVDSKQSQHRSRRSANQVKSSQKRPGSFAEYR